MQYTIQRPVAPWAPEPSAQSSEDVLRPMPPNRTSAEHPVLEAMAGSVAAHVCAHEEAVEYAAAQSNILRATGNYLDGLADDRGQVRARNELDEDFRTRILDWNDVVTRDAVESAVRRVTQELTGKDPVLFEPALDGWFVDDDGASSWASFVWNSSGGGTPQYDDRYYNLRTSTQILDALPIALESRAFGVIVPSFAQDSQAVMWVNDGTINPYAAGAPLFVCDGTEYFEAAFTSAQYTTDSEFYQAIVNAVEATRAHGVRWTLLDDSRI